jgi:hypothetical protein
VLLRTVSLPEMMRSKIGAFLDRREIRDVFDMEFLFKKGIELDVPAAKLKMLLRGIEELKVNDYQVKLASLLDGRLRRYYTQENFKILKAEIKRKLG